MNTYGKPESQVWAGLPQTEHSALTPLGEIEQATKIAEGIKQPRHGWRRAVVVIGLVLLALWAVAAVVGGMLSAAQQ
ncbi:hypothetical protein [Actinoplanes regularis]|uniref:Uncharacterized protein n=1 Tax=Actinoplanes regularis TaxID=52697 RepID=A0A238X5W0_9ACTN|nr:hypothetical protein [Actinoplanes regularis]GIE86479.1 hypothetical protein Are01nite_29590 [Actinoplanes regularis]SNR54297.1 hypothetical protein SAMN06264365_103104 [Actinoplanes regularis]